MKDLVVSVLFEELICVEVLKIALIQGVDFDKSAKLVESSIL